MLPQRRLLVGGGGSSFSAARTFQILAAPNGAWPSWTHAFYNSVTGSSLFAIVSDAGSVRVGEYVHATGMGSSTQVGVLSADQHNAPAVIRRSSDGRYLQVHCDHSGPSLHMSTSVNADDNSAWNNTYHIEDETGGTAFTYPFLCQLNDEASDPIYIIFRDVPSSDSVWNYSKSTGAGADGTWAARTTLVTGPRYYMRASKSSETRIDFALCAGSFAEDFASIYHFYYEGGAFKKSDGTSMGSPPFTTSQMTLAYDGSTNGARIPNSIAKLGSRIAITAPVFTGPPSGHIGTDGNYIVADWDGTGWSTHTLATAVGMTTLDFSEGGVVIDPSNLDHAAASIRVSGTWRMHDCVRNSATDAWQSTQITFTGSEDRYPWFVIDHQPALQYIWQKGTFTDEDHFNVATYGYGR